MPAISWPNRSVLQSLLPAAPLAAGPALANADGYWWHDAAWVEDSRGACCPDHARSMAV